MALKGNLRDFSTTQLLNLINLARKTGTLTIEGSEQAQMSFREGKLIYAAMNDDGSDLAHVLYRAGKLNEKQLQIIQSRAQGTSDKQLGHLLIQAGYVTQSDIIQSVRQHVLDVAYKLFTWADGLFRFEANTLPSSDRITIPIDLESVIMEGTRRLKEWERLQDEVPDLDVALKFTERPDARLRNINLTVEEWRVVSFINPRNTLRQIARANNLSDFHVRRIVYGLLQAGLVEYVDGPDARRRRAPRTRQPAGKQEAPANTVKQQSPTVKRSVVHRLIERIRSL
ncbi:MAG TPA: DUF4388 domain-containing protein [Candidatus Sulfomarinibacteraceae bacterium]|nr:DUF4388 domain-containing protein [Candidatus Sulfomarinibacteraceae bacterium]